jgi:hypothetical protein
MFAACSKDDNKVNAPDRLTGTSWMHEIDETVTIDDVEISVAIEMDFTSTAKGDLNILVGGVKDNTFAVSGFTAGEFTYTYSKPNVIVVLEGETEKGVVNEDKLVFSDGTVFIME